MTSHDAFQSRSDQALPTIAPAEIQRIERFGARACFRDGDMLLKSWGAPSLVNDHAAGAVKGLVLTTPRDGCATPACGRTAWW